MRKTLCTLALLLTACAPRDPAAVRPVPLTAEEQQSGRTFAFIVPVPRGAQGVAYGLSSDVYSVAALPEEARRRGKLRVTVGIQADGCQTREVQVWVGTFGACLPVPEGGYSMWPVEGGRVAFNHWTPLYTVTPHQKAGPDEPLDTPNRSRWGVAAVAFTTWDGTERQPQGLPDPSSVLPSLDELGNVWQS